MIDAGPPATMLPNSSGINSIIVPSLIATYIYWNKKLDLDPKTHDNDYMTKSIAVIGDYFHDVYHIGTVERISPEAPVPILVPTHTMTRLGGAGNVYNNLWELTLHVEMLTTVQSATPPTKTRFYANQHYLLRVDNDKGYTWSTDTSKLGKFDVVVVSDYNKGALNTLSDYWLQIKGRAIVDPKRSLELFRGAWCIKPNKLEFESTMGPWSSPDELERLMKQALKKYDFAHLIVTLGPDGVAYTDGEEFHVIPAHSVEVYDVTGAGDTFTAVLAYCILIGHDMLSAISVANRASAIAVSHFGTYIIKPDDIKFGGQTKEVFTNGCFDILHPGHIEYLRASRQLGDRLTVAINSDDSVRQLKGNGRPVNTAEHRAAMLEALPFVDRVIVFNDPTPRKLIEQLRPDIITKGGDYREEDVIGSDIAKAVIIPYNPKYSTTSIIKKILDEPNT